MERRESSTVAHNSSDFTEVLFLLNISFSFMCIKIKQTKWKNENLLAQRKFV